MPRSGPVAFPVPGFQGPPPGGGISPFPLPGMQGPAPAGPAMMPFSPGGFQGMPPAMPPQGPGAGIESLLGGMGGGGQMPPELLMRLLALRA